MPRWKWSDTERESAGLFVDRMLSISKVDVVKEDEFQTAASAGRRACWSSKHLVLEVRVYRGITHRCALTFQFGTHSLVFVVRQIGRHQSVKRHFALDDRRLDQKVELLRLRQVSREY